MTPLHIFLAVLTMALWGLNFVFVKIALEELPLFTLMSIRFLVVGISLVYFFRTPPASLPFLFLTAFVFSVLHAAAGFGGIAMGLSAGMTTIVEQTNAPFLLILSALFLKEKIGIRSFAGILLSFVGTYFLMQAPTSMNSPIGFLLVLCGAFFWAVYCLMLKKVKETHPLAIIGWIALLSAPINILISLIFEQGQIAAISNASINTWAVICYMIVAASFGAHALWYYLLSKVPVEIIGPTTIMVPFFGVIGGVLIIGEELSLQMMVGGVIMMVGVGVVLFRRPRTYERDIDV